MKPGDRKLRIALAVFDPAAKLGSAIAALLREGIPPSCLGLIASGGAVARLRREADCEAAARDPLDHLIQDLSLITAERDGSNAVLASPGLVQPWRDGRRLPALWGNHRDDKEQPRLAYDLERHVREGAVILTAESGSLREQWLCTRILLAQSSSTVLALECSIPPLPDASGAAKP